MFISPSVFSPSCAVWASLFPSLRLCATLSIIAIGQLLSKHCNLAAGCCSSRTSNIPNLLMSGTRPPVVSARLHRLDCSAARLVRLHGCLPARLPDFIPYAKVKKLILTHYILFIWKDRCMFFSDAAFRDAVFTSYRWISLAAASLPQRPGQQLCHGAPASSSATAPPLCSRSATASRPASPPQRPCQQHLPDGAPPRRPGQQQTSSGGEKYSGLASNLAHLGRIC